MCAYAQSRKKKWASQHAHSQLSRIRWHSSVSPLMPYTCPLYGLWHAIFAQFLWFLLLILPPCLVMNCCLVFLSTRLWCDLQTKHIRKHYNPFVQEWVIVLIAVNSVLMNEHLLNKLSINKHTYIKIMYWSIHKNVTRGL